MDTTNHSPRDWLVNEEIQLRDLRPLSRPAFAGELREQVLASPYRSVLVVVHGFRETFPSALRKTSFLAHVRDTDTPVLLFDRTPIRSLPIGRPRSRTSS